MTTHWIKRLLLGWLLIYGLCLAGKAQTESQQKKDQDELNQQLFPGAKLPPRYRFTFAYPFQEYTILTPDQVKLSGLLFKAKGPKASFSICMVAIMP